VIDLHSHILAGLDDGARTLDDSVAIAEAAVEAGVRTLVATPHVRADYPTTADTMESAVAATREALAARGIRLELLPGAELDLHYLTRLEDRELARLALGGNQRLLLVEFPYFGWPPELASRLSELRARGITVVLAHPERSDEVQAAPARLSPLVEAGTFVQLTAASLAGILGSRARATALELLDLGLAHLVAGDLHSPRAVVNAAELTDALRSDAALARWLSTDVPAALLRSEPPPPRPPRQRRRKRNLWRFRR
jgi:protein-tyrosine phosphatase